MIKLVELNDLNVWLKAEDIEESDVVTFQNEGRTVPKEESGFDEDGFEIEIILPKGTKRVWTMNKTAQRAVARDYGFDTKKWIGKTAILGKTKMNVRGKERDVITVRGTKAVVEEKVE